MADSYKIGRDIGRGPLRPSCTLRFKDGVITFSDEDPDHGPSTAERSLILAHFAAPVTVLRDEQVDTRIALMRETIEPGTLKHFEQAVYQIPKPFGRLPVGVTR